MAQRLGSDVIDRGLERGAWALLALDLDGTLMGESLTFSPRVRTAVQAAARQGVVVTVATGRARPSARQLQARLGVAGPLVSCQGALAQGPAGEDWLRLGLARDQALSAARWAEERGHEITFYTERRVFARVMRQPPEFYDRWFGLPREQLANWNSLPDALIKFLVVAGHPDEGAALEEEWRTAFGDRVGIVRSHPLFVEGVAPDASKGRALATVADRLGIPQGRVMAVGDNDNDRSMLEWAALGVAMGGAPESVRSVADVVAPGLEDDGAAWAIECFVLAEAPSVVIPSQ